MYKFSAEIPCKGKAIPNNKLMTSVTVLRKARRASQTCPLIDWGIVLFPKQPKPILSNLPFLPSQLLGATAQPASIFWPGNGILVCTPSQTCVGLFKSAQQVFQPERHKGNINRASFCTLSLESPILSRSCWYNMTTSRDKGEAHTKRSLIPGSVIKGQAEIKEIFSFLSYYQQVCKLNKPPASSERWSGRLVQSWQEL